MYFKMSFFALVRSCSEEHFAIYRHSTSICLLGNYASRQYDVCCRESDSSSSCITMDNFANNRREVDEGECTSTEQFFSFSSLELSERTIWHLSEHDMFDTDSFQFFHAMPTCLDHASDLSIFSFCEDDAESVRAYSTDFTGLCLDKFLFLEGILRGCTTWRGSSRA